ncbi:hypothetical protein BDQ12DRAFT_682836 [Crucibulum laeve]|uniref:F-box domain-containing protein n=1 Tax=Crucibulum laeve TaxID=68775 RepID=A0A5C3M583_9AGAR|nr:hypothetical protein BDQ12DRAFT_682836 [Crucibulum laeve]
MSSRSIPPEICGMICQDEILTRGDLRVLCGVSRSFRDESERLLYVNIILRSFRYLKSWCSSLSRRPHLGNRIMKMTITMPPQTDIEADDLGKIVAAFRKCTKLRELEILSDGMKTLPGDAVNAWILLGHPFRLTKFTNTYFQANLLVDFLKEQTELQVLSMRPKEKIIVNLPDDTLLNLSTIDASAAIMRDLGSGLWNPQNVKHLQYHLWRSTDEDELRTFVALVPFARILKSLSVQRTEAAAGLDIAILVSCIAAQVPDLKYLRVLDYSRVPLDASVPLLPFPIRFNCLEILILKPMTRVTLDGDDVTAFADLRGPISRFLTASRIMDSMPCLKRLVLITCANYSFRRLQDGNIETEGAVSLDDEEWMKQ